MKKYAVPVNSGKLSPHFGHCECFNLFDVDEESKEITDKRSIPSPEHQPGLLPKWLAERGTSVIIAEGMGPMAQELFSQNGVEVVIGATESDPEKLVLDHLNGQLVTGDNACDH